MEKGEKLFIVDLDTVSFFSTNTLKSIAEYEAEYKKVPFLFLVSSYIKNATLDFAHEKLTYLGEKRVHSWNIYAFQY